MKKQTAIRVVKTLSIIVIFHSVLACHHKIPNSELIKQSATPSSKSSLYYDVLFAHYLNFSGDHSAAIHEMDELLSKYPDDPAVWLHCAFFWIDLAQYAKEAQFVENLLNRANEIAKEGLTHFPNDTGLLNFLTDRSIERADFFLAAQYFEPVFESRPQDLDTCLKMASIYLETSRISDAIIILESARLHHPGSEKVISSLALAYGKAERYSEAEDQFRAFLLLVPDDYEARYNLAITYLKQNKIDESIEILLSIIEDYPKSPDPRIQIADLYVSKSEYALATDALLPLLDNPIADRDVRISLGKIKWLSGDLDGAERWLKDTLARYADSTETMIYLGMTYADKRDWKSALDLLSPILEKTPDSILLIDIVSDMMDRTGDLVGSLRLLENAIVRIPNNPRLYLALSGIYRRNGYADKAISVIQRACESIPGDRQLTLTLAVSYEQLHDWKNAIETAELLLDVNPEDPEVLNFIGYTLADYDQDLERAETMLQKAIEKEPNNPAYLDSMGWLLFRTGRFERAIELLQESLNYMNTDALIYDHLAQALHAAGRITEAVEALKRAIEINPDNQTYQDRLKTLSDEP